MGSSVFAVTVDEPQKVVIVDVQGKISKPDVDELTFLVDGALKSVGGMLNGIVIHTKTRPSWADLSAFKAHIQFIKQHKDKAKRIAFSTDSKIGLIAQKIAGSLTKARVKVFKYNELPKAIAWAATGV